MSIYWKIIIHLNKNWKYNIKTIEYSMSEWFLRHSLVYILTWQHDFCQYVENFSRSRCYRKMLSKDVRTKYKEQKAFTFYDRNLPTVYELIKRRTDETKSSFLIGISFARWWHYFLTFSVALMKWNLLKCTTKYYESENSTTMITVGVNLSRSKHNTEKMIEFQLDSPKLNCVFPLFEYQDSLIKFLRLKLIFRDFWIF